jgi:hypothetical protein
MYAFSVRRWIICDALSTLNGVVIDVVRPPFSLLFFPHAPESRPTTINNQRAEGPLNLARNLEASQLFHASTTIDRFSDRRYWAHAAQCSHEQKAIDASRAFTCWFAWRALLCLFFFCGREWITCRGGAAPPGATLFAFLDRFTPTAQSEMHSNAPHSSCSEWNYQLESIES